MYQKTDFRGAWLAACFGGGSPEHTISVCFTDREGATYSRDLLPYLIEESNIETIIDGETGELLYDGLTGEVYF